MSELAVLTDLYDATRAIGLADSLDQVIDDILDRAQELIGFEHCALMLRDEADGQLTVERIRGYGDRADAVLGMTIEQGEGLSGWAAERRQAVRVGDVKGDPRYLQGLREARSNLAVPLVVGNEVPGVINVESERPDAFTERHEKLLTVLGAQAALAILAGRARHRLQERLSQLDALYRISRLASRMRDLDETLRRILAITRRIAPEGQVAILLLEPEGHLRVRAAEGYKEGVEELTIPLGEGITGHCAATQETVVVDEVDARPLGLAPRWGEYRVPLPDDGRKHTVKLTSRECLQPAELGLGPDQRCLAFRLRDFPGDRFELYDVVADPSERRDLSADRLNAVSSLRDGLEAFRREPVADSESAVLDPATEQRLRELGYLH